MKSKAIIFYTITLIAFIFELWVSWIFFLKEPFFSGEYRYLFLGASIFQLILILWMGSDCLRRKFNTPAKRNIWLFAIIFLGVFGTTIYYLVIKRKEWMPENSWLYGKRGTLLKGKRGTLLKY